MTVSAAKVVHLRFTHTHSQVDECYQHEQQFNCFFFVSIADNHKEFQPTPLLNVDDQGMFVSAINFAPKCNDNYKNFNK